MEANLDGLVGPTHHYGGLGVGNKASQSHAGQSSFPRQGALQGLEKMRKLHELGIPQGLLPPSVRPLRKLIREAGFLGEWEDQLATAYTQAPEILSAAFSSAFMWTANAATVCPSMDSSDRKLHITPANLVANIHRFHEAEDRSALLRHALGQTSVAIHPPLPSTWYWRDEGAANHMRLWGQPQLQGVHLFVYGADHQKPLTNQPYFLSRQSLAASQAIARQHQIPNDRVHFLTQSSIAIQSGVFHNDVIATSHENLLLYHEDAFDELSMSTLESLESTFPRHCGKPLHRCIVSRNDLSLNDAVATYLFNSQIVSPSHLQREPIKSMMLIAPTQCEHHAQARSLIERWMRDASHPIADVLYLPLDQSMSNGGGPACLRLRVELTPEQQAKARPELWFSSKLYDETRRWIEDSYPTTLRFEDLRDPAFAEHAQAIVMAYRERYGWPNPKE
ncbi:MAG: N-succinylarginine dihydrolase [Pirellulales bacterium]